VNRKFLIVLMLTLFYGQLSAQKIGNFRTKELLLNSDTIVVDTLSIIPGSFRFVPEMDSSFYQVDFGSAKIIIRNRAENFPEKLKVEYRVFPLLFNREYFHRDYEETLSPDSLLGREKPEAFGKYDFASQQDENIRTSGSFTRGISVGNNQDFSLTSGMNIRLSGELGDGLMVEGAISDNAVPLQPQGNTRKIEEFDRIYLKVYKDNFAVQAGDIDLVSSPNSQILKFARNVQGLSYSGKVSGKEKDDSLMVTAAASVAKGKFARNQIQGVEGNQGPYRLQGTNGETFIIVISGSERVYVDGIMLTRGEDANYVIDYNVAEVTFTPNTLINRNSRIVVEFEYSERSYARFNTFADVVHHGKKFDWNFSVYSESDAKNQPYDQDLTEDQKELLYNIGDNTQQAFIEQVDSVDFNPDVILYQKVDTLAGSEIYQIFRHSVNPEVAHFRVQFSYVGEGKGNYVAEFGSANGRVYRWVAPENGAPQGNYEPVRRLIAPTKKQMVTAGISKKWGKGSFAQVNYALSNTDLNTFSPTGNDDDFGHAVKATFNQNFSSSDSTKVWLVGADIFKSTSNFRFIDRFRDVEFERNWGTSIVSNGANEQQVNGWVEYSSSKKSQVHLGFENLSIGNNFSGNRGSFNGWQNFRGVKMAWNGYLVSSSDSMLATSFLRGKFTVEKPFWKMKVGIETEAEQKISETLQTDSLHTSSFQWYSLKASVGTSDSLKVKSNLSYTLRSDFLPYGQSIMLAGKSNEISSTISTNNQKIGSINATVGYRVYSPANIQVFTNQTNEETFLGRLEYSKRFFKGFWTFAAGYELGSGLEPKTEYYYVEVPAGQGVFAWIDFNGNGIKELDEFEVANFSDEAKYLRINILGSNTIRVKTNAVNLRSNINPAAVFKNNEGFISMIGKLSNQTSFSARQKNRFEDFWLSANPFPESAIDTSITSYTASARNSLAFNRNSRKIGSEYIFTESNNKALLSNGFEMSETNSHRLVLWFGIVKNLSARIEGDKFSRASTSQYFESKNYTVTGMEPQISIKYEGIKDLTLETIFKIINSESEKREEKSSGQSIVLQTNYSFPGRSSVSSKISMVKIDFTGNPDSPVGYEMLKGLQSGTNWVWEAMFRQKLSRYLEMELTYSGRMLNSGKIVHTGSMQARALF